MIYDMEVWRAFFNGSYDPPPSLLGVPASAQVGEVGQRSLDNRRLTGAFSFSSTAATTLSHLPLPALALAAATGLLAAAFRVLRPRPGAPRRLLGRAVHDGAQVVVYLLPSTCPHPLHT